ncbi:hypothetical protein MJO29_005510 [Puccinia striiformis f. sp. tritici]|nr:hypothetical protein MJO29_005510 [Puccinia striiformis f. sp. tritici]
MDLEQRKFKLLPTAERGIMLGYENDFSSYRIYKPSSRKAFRIRNVKFDETIFPGLKDHDPNPEEDVFETEETNDNVEVNAPVNSVELETHQPPTPVTSQPDDVESTLNEPGQNQGRKAPRDINSAISTDNILTREHFLPSSLPIGGLSFNSLSVVSELEQTWRLEVGAKS